MTSGLTTRHHRAAFTIGIDGDEGHIHETSYDLGLDTRAGLHLHINAWVSLFAEYRFTYYELDVDDDVLGGTVDVESQIATHHVVGGLGFQF